MQLRSISMNWLHILFERLSHYASRFLTISFIATFLWKIVSKHRRFSTLHLFPAALPLFFRSSWKLRAKVQKSRTQDPRHQHRQSRAGNTDSSLIPDARPVEKLMKLLGDSKDGLVHQGAVKEQYMDVKGDQAQQRSHASVVMEFW